MFLLIICNIWQHWRQNNVSGRHRRPNQAKWWSDVPPPSHLPHSLPRHSCMYVSMCVWGHGYTALAGNTKEHIHMLTQLIPELPTYASRTHNYVPTFYRPWNGKTRWKLLWHICSPIFLKATFKDKFLPHRMRINTAANLLKARTVKPAGIAVARERLCKHATGNSFIRTHQY
jgi:hypothetical protein